MMMMMMMMMMINIVILITMMAMTMMITHLHGLNLLLQITPLYKGAPLLKLRGKRKHRYSVSVDEHRRKENRLFTTFLSVH